MSTFSTTGTCRTALLATTLALVACADAPPPVDLPACSVAVFTQEVAVSRLSQVDLLLVVDDSASMGGQQRSLRADVTRALHAAGVAGDRAQSVHVAVITTDMGVGGPGSLSAGCERPLGGDGRMLREHTGGDPACAGVALTQPFVAFEPGGDLDAAIDQVACLAHTGAAGCGFEQPLEAALKALTSATSTLRFVRERGGAVESDTAGHGDGANAGFLRQDSLLVIAFLSDEDDCSSGDMYLYTPTGATPQYPSPLTAQSADPSAQCASYRGALHPVQRYVDGFAALRPGAEHRLALVTVAGVDPTLLDAHSTEFDQNGYTSRFTDYSALLADPGMSERIDASGAAVVPVCRRPDPADPTSTAAAFPALPSRRLLQVAQRMQARGASAQVSSICSPVDAVATDYTLDLRVLTSTLAPPLAPDEGPPGAALPRPYPRDVNGRIACEWTETLPSGARCADVAGRTLLRLDDDREVCVVEQIAVPPADRVPGAIIAGDGWYYDDFNPSVGWWSELARYAPGSEAIPGARFRVECLTYPPRTADAGVHCGASTD